MIDRRTFIAGCVIGAFSLSSIGCSNWQSNRSNAHLGTINSIEATPIDSNVNPSSGDTYIWFWSMTQSFEPIVVEADIPDELKNYKVAFFVLGPDTIQSPELNDVDNVFKTEKRRIVDEIQRIDWFADQNDITIPHSEYMRRLKGLRIDQYETVDIGGRRAVIAQGGAVINIDSDDPKRHEYGNKAYGLTCSAMYVHFNESDHPDLSDNNSFGACALIVSNDEFDIRDESYDPNLVPDMRAILEKMISSMRLKILKDSEEYSTEMRRCYDNLNNLYA